MWAPPPVYLSTCRRVCPATSIRMSVTTMSHRFVLIVLIYLVPNRNKSGRKKKSIQGHHQSKNNHAQKQLQNNYRDSKQSLIQSRQTQALSSKSHKQFKVYQSFYQFCKGFRFIQIQKTITHKNNYKTIIEIPNKVSYSLDRLKLCRLKVFKQFKMYRGFYQFCKGFRFILNSNRHLF